jgi:hypothetical protein
MTAKEVLTATKAKLREGTCKGSYARDAAGSPVAPVSPRAVAWCPAGAILLVTKAGTGVTYPKELIEACDCLANFTPYGSITAWWDRPEMTEAELFEWIDQAIEAAS